MGRKLVSQIRSFFRAALSQGRVQKLTSEEAFSHQFPSKAGEGPEGVSGLPSTHCSEERDSDFKGLQWGGKRPKKSSERHRFGQSCCHFLPGPARRGRAL